MQVWMSKIDGLLAPALGNVSVNGVDTKATAVTLAASSAPMATGAEKQGTNRLTQAELTKKAAEPLNLLRNLEACQLDIRTLTDEVDSLKYDSARASEIGRAHV